LEKADFTGKGTAEKARYGKRGVSDREKPSEQFSDGLPQQGPLKQPYPSCFTAQPPSNGYCRSGKILGNSTIDRLLRFGERRGKSAVKDKKAV